MTSRNIEHFVVLEGPLHEIKTLLEDDTRSSILEESIIEFEDILDSNYETLSYASASTTMISTYHPKVEIEVAFPLHAGVEVAIPDQVEVGFPPDKNSLDKSLKHDINLR
ncbi:hypothetical protein Golax_000297, partial [Gossypium laxum]|nr:hypothetical protein [Gossypium laxum]